MEPYNEETNLESSENVVKNQAFDEHNWQTCSDKKSYVVNGQTLWLHITAYYEIRPGTLYYWAESFASSDEGGKNFIIAEKFEIELEGEGTPWRLGNATGVRTPVSKSRYSSGLTLTAATRCYDPNMGLLSVSFPC
ncbi:MAG TPA: hypothetical protein VGC76_14650 [Pyrinomonadaceae bacterium]|jgi:hypothetical protein